jgi:hypothetical protein
MDDMLHRRAPDTPSPTPFGARQRRGADLTRAKARASVAVVAGTAR